MACLSYVSSEVHPAFYPYSYLAKNALDDSSILQAIYNEHTKCVMVYYMDGNVVSIPIKYFINNPTIDYNMFDISKYIYTDYTHPEIKIDLQKTLDYEKNKSYIYYIFANVKGFRFVDCASRVILPNNENIDFNTFIHSFLVKLNRDIQELGVKRGYYLDYSIVECYDNTFEILIKTFFVRGSSHAMKVPFLLKNLDMFEVVYDKYPDIKEQKLPANRSLNVGDKCSLVYKGEDDFQEVEKSYVIVGQVKELNGIEIDGLIVKQVGGIETTIFSLTKTDCKILGIEYRPGLQLFPRGMGWIFPKNQTEIENKRK